MRGWRSANQGHRQTCHPSLFERVALVIPPAGHAAGRYASWLESHPGTGQGDFSAKVLVVGNRGDQAHPARVAEAWAEQLGAHLELLPSRAVYTDAEEVAKFALYFGYTPKS